VLASPDLGTMRGLDAEDELPRLLTHLGTQVAGLDAVDGRGGFARYFPEARGVENRREVRSDGAAISRWRRSPVPARLREALE
jgi:hypothetical protein